jgi:predicted Rossmann fold nucleotide-binding protein DprA/Smf involved in DNA uptake
MLPTPTILAPKDAHYPSARMGLKEGKLFPQIWALGDAAILQRPLLGFFCSVKCPGDLILRTYDLARALRDAGVPVISGFHTPIEKDCLDLLLRGSQPVVVCPARSILNMRLGKSLKANIEKGRVLLLSPIEETVKRPTAEASQRRNQFVGALSAGVFVSYAEPGGKTEELCKEILQSGKPLYTFESQYNKAIVEIGAKLVDTATLTQWACSLKAMVVDG